jgi:hypothetical protein
MKAITSFSKYRALSENVEDLKTIVGGHFLVFTQPGPKADVCISSKLARYNAKDET